MLETVESLLVGCRESMAQSAVQMQQSHWRQVAVQAPYCIRRKGKQITSVAPRAHGQFPFAHQAHRLSHGSTIAWAVRPRVSKSCANGYSNDSQFRRHSVVIRATAANSYTVTGLHALA